MCVQVYAVSLRGSPKTLTQTETGTTGNHRRLALKKLTKGGQEGTVHALAELRALLVARDCPFIVILHSAFQTKVGEVGAGGGGGEGGGKRGWKGGTGREREK